GLLVGLAFIILFAIILSEKGAGPRPQGTPQFTQADLAQRGPERGGATLTDAGKLALPVEPVRVEPRRAHSKSTAAAPIAAVPTIAEKRESIAPVAPDSAGIGKTDALAAGIAGSGPIAAADIVDSAKPESELPKAPLASGAESKSTRRGGFAFKTDSLQAKLDSLTARVSESIESVPPTEAVETTAEAAAPVEGSNEVYTVQSGDTLTSIAKKTCGHCGPSAIDAICMANPTTLK